MAAAAVTGYLADHGRGRRGPRAAVEGYHTAFWWAAAIFAVGAIVTGSLLRSGARAAAGTARRSPWRRRRRKGRGRQPRPAATSRSYFSVMCATAWFCCSA
jgi:hypothetical protein